MDSVGFSRSSLFLSHLRKPREKKRKEKGEKKNPEICFLCRAKSNPNFLFLDRIMQLGSSDLVEFEFDFWKQRRIPIDSAAERWRGGVHIAATMAITLGLVRIAVSSSLESDWPTVPSGRVLVWGIWTTMQDPGRVLCKAGRTIRLLPERLLSMALRLTAMPRRISFLAHLLVAVRGRKVWVFVLQFELFLLFLFNFCSSLLDFACLSFWFMDFVFLVMDYCLLFLSDRLRFYVIILWINGRNISREFRKWMWTEKSIVSMLEEKFDGEIGWYLISFPFYFLCFWKQ